MSKICVDGDFNVVKVDIKRRFYDDGFNFPGAFDNYKNKYNELKNKKLKDSKKLESDNQTSTLCIKNYRSNCTIEDIHKEFKKFEGFNFFSLVSNDKTTTCFVVFHSSDDALQALDTIKTKYPDTSKTFFKTKSSGPTS